MTAPHPDASVVITTRNRREDTLRAVASCLAQTECHVEVLVFDDASEDGTAEAVGHRFPEVRLFASPVRSGYIAGRNRGFREAAGRYVFSIDDDAYFVEPDTVSSVVALFDADDSVGAVAIPYIEPYNRRSLSSLRSPAKLQPLQEVRSYVGCAHAIRRDVALALEGYREYFVHQGEERDLCLRLRHAGWRVIYAPKGQIVHTVHPRREPERVNHYGARNKILFNWLNLPLPALLVRLAWDPIAILRYRFTWTAVPGRIRGIVAGFAAAARHYREREPVSSSVYREYRELAAHGPVEWQGVVPPPCEPSPDTEPGAREENHLGGLVQR